MAHEKALTFEGKIAPGEVVTTVVGEDGKVQERRYTRDNDKLGFPMDASGPTMPAPGGGAYGSDGKLRPGWVRNGDGTLSGPDGRVYGRGGHTRRQQRERLFNSLEALADRVDLIETALEASGVILPDPVVDLAVAGPRA